MKNTPTPTKGTTDPTLTTNMPLGPTDNATARDPSARGLAQDDLSAREDISQVSPDKSIGDP